jgi:hypothetical protein
LNDFLYGPEAMQVRFERFANMLVEIGASKWTIATYLLFSAFPKEHMFVKPVVTQEAAKVLGYEINYRPELNWLTYKNILELSEKLRRELLKEDREELVPRDMVDIHSYIWIMAPSYQG